MKLFKGIIVSAMAIVMLIPSFAFADDGPFIKDLSKLRDRPYEWKVYDKNGELVDENIVLIKIKIKLINARHVETHGVKMPDGKEFIKDYYNNIGDKVTDDNYAISKGRENSVCVVKNKDVKYRDKDVFKRVYLNELGLQDKVEFSDDWYMKEILYACAVPNTEVELTEVYVGGKKANTAPIKLKVNEDCSLSPVDDTTKVEGDVVNIYLGKKPANSDKPVVNPSDNNKPSDKPSVDKPNTDKPNADKPVVDNNKPVDKVDANKPVDKVDSAKPVVDNKANQNVNNVVKRPAVANADAPKTSDGSNIALYSMLLIGSVGAISVVFRRKLRTNK